VSSFQRICETRTLRKIFRASVWNGSLFPILSEQNVSELPKRASKDEIDWMDKTPTSVRPKQEFSLSAETECSAAKNHRIFGIFLYSWQKFGSSLHNQLKIRITNAKFDSFFLTKLESCLVFVADSILKHDPNLL
jgi:hypothetical protein